MLVLLLIASIQLKTVWEKTFTEPVVDVWVEEQTKMMAVVTKEAVLFYDNGNKISELKLAANQISELEYKSPLIAFKSNKIVVISREKEYEFKVGCYTIEGKLIWEKQNLLNPVFLSGNEEYLVSGSPDLGIERPNKCILFDLNTGAKLWERNIESDFWMCHILETGEVVILENIYWKDTTKIYFINTKGEELWEYVMPTKISVAHMENKTSDIILHWTDFRKMEEIILFSKEGKVRWKLENINNNYINMDVDKMVISNKTVYLLDVWKEDEIIAIDLRDGTIRWRLNLGNTPYSEISIDGKGKILLLSTRPQYRSIRPIKRNLLLINTLNGEIIQKIDGYGLYGEFIRNTEKILLRKINEPNNIVIKEIKKGG